MIPDIPEISVFAIPLDTAGMTVLRQRVGYFHLWQYENTADGSVSLDGVITAVFGGQAQEDDAVPLGYNSRVQLRKPVDMVTLRWAAQAGRRARIVIGPSAENLEANNIPARQLVFPQAAGNAGSATATVGTAAVQVLTTEANRFRAVLQADPANTANIDLGTGGVTVGNGIVLVPGASFEFRATRTLFGISSAAGQVLRILREFS